MTEREALLKKLSAQEFAALELHLYLDSHPGDLSTAAKLAEFKEKAKFLRREYEEKYGPLSMKEKGANRWAWISNPWPWDPCSEED